jgi:hypothetical protein
VRPIVLKIRAILQLGSCDGKSIEYTNPEKINCYDR